MANNSANVSAAKPKVGGAIFWAPAGTEVPTDAVTPLTGDFKNVGYVSEDGLTEKETRTSQKDKAWGGDTVNYSQTEYEKNYSFKMIETNETTMTIRHGKKNVSATEGKLSKVVHTAEELPKGVWVFEMIIASMVVRKVISEAMVTETGEVSYKDSGLVAYPATLGVLPDKNGQYVVDYYAAVTDATEVKE